MKKILILFFSILSLAAISVSIYLLTTGPKIAYVDIRHLYNNFEYKIQLEQELTSITENRTARLDSIMHELNIMSRKLQSQPNPPQTLIDSFNLVKGTYLDLEQKFDEEYSRLVNVSDEKIYKQITQYVLDFGQVSNYTYILGADGSGNVMYAPDNKNITEEVLSYINKRYNGKDK